MRRVIVIADANVDRADPADAIGSTPSAEEVAVRCCRPTLKPGPEAIDSALVSAAVARAAASATRTSARLRSRIPNTRGVDRSARAKFWLLAVQGTPPRWETRFVLSSFVLRRRGDGAFGLTSAPSAHFGRHTAMELEAAADVVDQQLRRFGLRMDAARCPRELEGRWRVDKANSQTLCPFVVGLGVPRFACPAIGLLERTTELTIRCTGPDDRAIRIEDKTAFSSRNVTEVTCDGVETEKASKTGRKRFYLSGATAPDSNTSVVKCRLHQRGEGWETRQERRAVGENRLRERNVLVRPGEEDVIVDRFFDRVEERKP